MTKAEDLLARIETECIKYKGLYTWLDEVIEDIIQNAKDLLNNFPSDNILDKMEVDFVCEDHHDGYIHEVFVSYVDPEKKACHLESVTESLISSIMMAMYVGYGI